MEKMFFFALAVALLVALMAAAAKSKRKTSEDRYSGKPLLTENEKAWFKVLKEAAPDVHVFAQVALNQLVKAEGKGPQWRSAKNKIDPRSIDFVLMNPDLAVLMAIEIDDRLHRSEKGKTDDAKKNKALADAQITLLRFPSTPVVSPETVKKQILDAIVAKARAKAQT